MIPVLVSSYVVTKTRRLRLANLQSDRVVNRDMIDLKQALREVEIEGKRRATQTSGNAARDRGPVVRVGRQ